MVEMKTFETFDFKRVKLKNHKGNKLDNGIVAAWLNSNYQNLLLVGNTGIGKSHLSEAILNQFIDKRKNDLDILDIEFSGTRRDKLKSLCVFYHAMNLYKIFLEEIRSNEAPQDAADKIRRIIKAELFILDDLGVENDTEVFPRGILNVLTCRGSKRMITTTNLDVEEIFERYKDKIGSRLLENCMVIIVEADDYRLRRLK